MRLLIAEDNRMLAQALEGVLLQSGYTVDIASTGADANHLEQCTPYDLVILDLQLPELDGFEVLTRMRMRKSRVPVLILSVHDTLDQRVKGLNLGADDFVGKPFETPELEARVRALLRRGMFGNSSVIQLGALTFDTVDRVTTLHGKPLIMPSKELAVLELLLMRIGRVVSKQSLFDRIYDCDDLAGPSVIEIYIHRLRRKLETAGLSIHTIRGLGYMIDESMH
ncbi:DNA-binding response regulator [Agaricicola taiwanensis]|uniref:DNA-binding response regulator n=1 Tax=Agaricicola taiwanensis TaxID=591372 RepID=A0A8J2YM25_9RHOB|nr:response regulator [Agaricicola taiwanensis]GGE52562.1 DNA-binding response regulator [Agaricicola taiwanensis]